MPRVKIDYIVSFSSEDSESTASNLLANEVSKKKWLCGKGESSGSIVFQLMKSVKLCAVHIGAYHAALVEVLVGRSETPNEPFKVIVPSCIFLSPSESRKGDGIERVRSFTLDQLAADVVNEKWDRVRVVCSQPYNKHAKFGLSFVHIFEPEGATGTTSQPAHHTVPNRLLLLQDAKSSDEEVCYKPGDLFSKYMENKTKGNSSTDAQIRHASSQAIKNLSDSATKLVKTPISKEKTKSSHSSKVNYDCTNDRQRNDLMYDKEDTVPNEKVDKIIQRHNDEKAKNDKPSTKAIIDSPKQNTKKESNKFSFALESDKTRKIKDSNQSCSSRSEKSTTPQSHKKDKEKNSFSKDDKNCKKRAHSDDRSEQTTKRLKAGPVSSSPHELLSGVKFVLSGYENPRRAALRDRGLALGARYSRDWDQSCTHLICAFPKTPKLHAVRSSSNGADAVIVTGEWLEECSDRRRLLPWQWFATEAKLRVKRTRDEEDDVSNASNGGDGTKDDDETECDTDDEIDKVLQKQKKNGVASNSKVDSDDDNVPSTSKDVVMNASQDSDVTFVRDERVQGNVTITDSDGDVTEEEVNVEIKEEIDASKCLPNFFEGYTFLIDDGVIDVGFDKELLKRYIRAYGGEILELSHMEDDSEVNYIVCAGAPCEATKRAKMAPALRADWLWQCHSKRRLYSIDKYIIK